MKIKKIITILTFFLLFSCGFEPIHSKKKLDNRYNFTISNITFLGDNKVNQTLKNNLKNYINIETKPIKYDLVINSSSVKVVTSKNKKGNPEAFSMEITINADIYKAENLINQITLKEDFEYKNKSTKFELRRYEENIKKNLTSKASEDIIKYLYSIQ